MPSSKITKFLNKVYDEEVEHVGFVLEGGKVIEVENIAEDKSNGFDVSGEDIIKYADKAVASWHTHPGKSSNLSALDYETFLAWPNMDHYIIGNDGITKYVVEGDDVLVA